MGNTKKYIDIQCTVIGFFLCLGSSSRRIDGNDAACDVNNDVVDQQFSSSGRLHESHRRLVQPLRHLRLPGAARVRSGQLCRKVTIATR